MVRAKFQVTSVKKHFCRDYQTDAVVTGSTEVILTPQYDQSIEEDRRFAKATPSGTISLFIDNPPAALYLEPGQNFYVDFTKVEDAPAT